MKRIRILALAALSVLALGAWADAASAAPTEFQTEATSTIDVKGTIGGSGINYFEGGGWIATCSASSLKSALGSSGSTVLTSSSWQETSCEGPGPDWKLNGCTPTFRPGAETEPGTFTGTVDIVCPVEQTIYIENFAFSCDYTVWPKNGIPATFKNTGTGSSRAVEVTLGGKSQGLKYTLSSPCGSGAEKNDGNFHVAWLLKGYEAEKQVGVWLQVAKGLFISSPGGANTKFDGEAFPLPVAGSVFEEVSLEMPEFGRLSCESSSMSGTLAAASPSLSIKGPYSGCKTGGFATTVVMNSCSLAFDLNESGAPYTGSQNLGCEVKGDSVYGYVKFFGVTICSIVIPPQELGATSYQNLGTGNGRYVRAETEGEGITYTLVKHHQACPSESATYENGVFTGGTDLKGV